MEEAYASLVGQFDRLEDSERQDLEKVVGPLVDRLLLAEGIAAVDGATREMLLPAFLTALRQGMDVRRRKAGGDYEPDPKSEGSPNGGPVAVPRGSAQGLKLRSPLADLLRIGGGKRKRAASPPAPMTATGRRSVLFALSWSMTTLRV